jgi:hypothetical protein
MFFSFMAAVVIILLTRIFQGYEMGVIEGRSAERREGLDQIKAQMAKVVFDQQQIMSKLEFREPAE